MAVIDEDFVLFDELSLQIQTDTVGGSVYIGYARSQTTDKGAPDWLIKRITTAGSEIETIYASQKFNKVWDDRVTIFGTAPFSNDRSILCDGTNDHILIGVVSELNFDRLDSFSVSCWTRTNSNATQVLVSKQGSGNNLGWRYGFESGQFRFHLSGGAAGNRLQVRSIAATYGDDNWHHTVMTYDGSGNGSGVTIYVDDSDDTGSVLTDTLTTATQSTTAAQISGRSGTVGELNGFIDEVSIWDKELSSAEVSEIYNSGSPDNLSTHSAIANLVGWWRCGDNDTFPIIRDLSTSANNATMTNMTVSDIVGEVP